MKTQNSENRPRNVTLSFCASADVAALIRRAGNRTKSRSATIWNLICPRKLARLQKQFPAT